MKANIVIGGVVLATLGCVLLYPTLRGDAAGVVVQNPVTTYSTPVQAAATAKRVQAVFLLDTTGSMGGLIATAKNKIWSIASTLAQARQGPEVSIGLVAYRDRGDAYVTRVIDLSSDLDRIHTQLMTFAAEGGGDTPEAVNQALEAALEQISWSNDPDTYKVVFLVGDAPPHMDYQDDLKYPQLLAMASARGIVVNTIQCGTMDTTVAPWQHIAALGQGRYFTVEQAGGAIQIETPYDRRMAELAAELDGTRFYYGSAEEREAGELKMITGARVRRDSSVSAQATRGAFNAGSTGVANFLGGRELVDDVASGRVQLEEVAPEELPEALAAMTSEERSALIAENIARRGELQQEISALAAERDAFIEAEVDAGGGAADSLDQQIFDAVREQAAPLGLEYEGGPKF
jgi:Mg-chelatase subunit ChlD